LNQRDFEIVELRDYERHRSETEAALGAAATRILVETPILDATNGEQIFEGIRASILDNPPGRWVLDLKQVRFIDSAAMTALVHLVADPRLAGRLKLEGAGSGLKRRWPQIFGSSAADADAPAEKGGR
jgi:hypothetical protein